MGTRSLIIMRVQNNDGTFTIYCVLYQQFDGYPDGVGKVLTEFISGIELTTGISFKNGIEPKMGEIANGPACLFAQIVNKFKKRVGGAYIHPPSEDYIKNADAEYFYYLDVVNYSYQLIEDMITLTVKHGDDIVFVDKLSGTGNNDEKKKFLLNYKETFESIDYD